MNSTRRAFLGTALGAAAVAGLGTVPASAAAAGRCRRIPPSAIGMHLYTMRTPLATDFRGTLERLAEIGYATVGVSGRHGNSAADIRRMLDGTRLKAVLEHVAYDIVRGAGLPQALEDIHTLGGKWIVVPSLPGSLHSPAGYREVAREFNKAGLAARESGLKLLYHNHGTDHQVVDGVSLYDILLAETDPELVGFELDLYWAANGGASAPGELFVRHPRRFPALHVKDMAPDGDFADVGSGVLDFPAMFDTARRGGVKQWLVEHDSPTDPFASALASYTYLSRLRY
ncbi:MULTISPECIES: sugar phosphate isomerase/epimerase [unclassified Streptomyces]|uniref:sugar phosphate isomerase/epimerase family protein n=1 Tax=unclassified Streptomyces TaxID=2593676 RepID=UPI0029BA1CF7|nr:MULTISPECIES: sugar phosphate isomerase/epimerase [unclassified Streptomyces]MDX3768671.1 sugar phosphate isomerase/epimerase [Streptomyces sp. AK08-01B]MDX3818605.1 sugar phosphate isomerase/epimerase [Streptomyces sp. AK08-01A]